MRLRLSALALVSAALMSPLAAHADTDTFTVTGTDYSFSFALPTSFAIASADSFGDYNFKNVSVDYAGKAYTGTVTFYDATDFAVYDTANYASYLTAGTLYTTNGGRDIFTQQSLQAIGNVNCSASLTMPGIRSMPTLALLQMPSLGTVCNDPSTVTVGGSTPVSATPEPASLLLLGTGALGLVGIATRRLWS